MRKAGYTSRILSGWKEDREAIEKQLASQQQPASEPEIDGDALIEELHHLEEHLAGNESALAREAFRRVYKSVTLYWNDSGRRYLAIERAEVEPHHPFALTATPSSRVHARIS